MREAIISSPYSGLVLILIFLGVAAWFGTRLRNRRDEFKTWKDFRGIPFFDQIDHAILMSVEGGERIHYSTGSGGIFDQQGAAGLSGVGGIPALSSGTRLADRPVYLTSGDGTITLLAEQAQHGFQSNQAPLNSNITGLTPFSYTAGAALAMRDDSTASNFMAGHFEAEVGLMVDDGFRQGGQVLGGSDSLIGQSVLAATGHTALIGEELFVTPAYLSKSRWHSAALIAQDILRWVVVALIIAGLLMELLQVK